MSKPKLVRITTVPISLEKLITGQMRYMSQWFEVTAISSGKEELERVGAHQGVAVFPLEMSRKITPLADVLAVWKLYRYFKKTKPQIVHSHTPKAGIVGMLAAYCARVPHRLHTVAGMPLLEEQGIKRKILNFVERLTYACATQVYPNSNGLREIIIANQLAKAEDLKVLANGSSNGIDISYFDPAQYSQEFIQALQQDLGITKDDFVFIFIGRLVKDKGINDMVAAFTQLYPKHSHIKLLLVGNYENDLDPLLPETVQHINTHPNIIATGYQSDVRPYLAVAHVLVFPSYREGFPNVVMQAGAMGLPSIVSNINGCNEIIIEGKNGLIVPVKNQEVLQQSMQKLIQDKALYHQMKNEARAMIVSRYDQKVVWEAIKNEYDSLFK